MNADQIKRNKPNSEGSFFVPRARLDLIRVDPRESAAHFFSAFTNSLRYNFFAEILGAILRDVAQPGSAHPWGG